MPSPPRIGLLSATIGEPEHLRAWLSPCQLISSSACTALSREVWVLDDPEVPDDLLVLAIRDALSEPDTSVVVFVYRREAADTLARKLSAALSISALSYNSGQSANQRMRARTEFQGGHCRCLVSTTALAMGVNLPATHIFIRDTTFFGFGKLGVDELLQILGRAGRGDRRGHRVVLLRSANDWDADQLANLLRTESLPPLRSSFEVAAKWQDDHDAIGSDPRDMAAAAMIASCLGRAGGTGLSRDQIGKLLGNTLGARSLSTRVDSSLRWLTDPSHVVAYGDEQRQFRLTALGQTGVRSMLPLNYLAGLGQLLRDLISLNPDARLLQRWSALDHLVVASILSDRAPKLRRFSEALAAHIDGWHENRPLDEKSLIFAQWVMGSTGASKADEIFGSLGIATKRKERDDADGARKRAYTAMLSAIALDERSRGISLIDIEQRWGLTSLDGLDESWRDTALWLLAGHANVFEVRAFYHHLREHCDATDDQVKVMKQAFGAIRSQAYHLLERLKYCSPLGPMLRGIRAGSGNNEAGKKPGIATIRRLEAAGVTNLIQLRQLSIDALIKVGLQKRDAKQIRAYIERRMR